MVFSSRDILVFVLQNTDDQIHPNFISILTLTFYLSFFTTEICGKLLFFVFVFTSPGPMETGC